MYVISDYTNLRFDLLLPATPLPRAGKPSDTEHVEAKWDPTNVEQC